MPSGENGETPEDPADDPLPMAEIDDPGEDFAAKEPRAPATDGEGGETFPASFHAPRE